MSDFLARLAERQLTGPSGVAPRLPSRFAPTPLPSSEPTPVSRLHPGDADEPATPVHRAGRGLDAHDVTRPTAPLLDVNPVRAHVVQAPRALREGEANPGPTVPRPAAVGTTPAAELSLVPPEILAAEPLVPALRSAAEVSPTAAVTPRADIVPANHESEISAPPAAHPRPAPQPLVPRGPSVPGPTMQPVPVTEPLSGAAVEPPIVKVTIGRVEVRAVMLPPARERPKKEAPKALSLEEYLERRHGGRR